jgi:hypothetical protein
MMKTKVKVGTNLKEKLYTISINEAFDEDCECPICFMKRQLEVNSIEFTMGSSYMDDVVRLETDKIGFCTKHLKMLYENQNRLGFALILKTHMDKTIKDIEKLSSNSLKLSSPSLFKKKAEASPLTTYLNQLEHSCYVCNMINNTFDRYIDTIFMLYKDDSEFRTKFNNTKGICTSHYNLLYQEAPKYLKSDLLNTFCLALNTIYIDNMKRVRDDLEWFINKFDYRYVNEPWKNSKDALPRAMVKVGSIL